MATATMTPTRVIITPDELEEVLARGLSELTEQDGRDLRDLNAIMEDGETIEDAARAALSEAITFLRVAAGTDQPISPSSVVDFWWHQLILDTEFYAGICQRLNKGFLHHRPTPMSDRDGTPKGSDNTLLAFAAAGFKFQSRFWPTAAKCVITPRCDSHVREAKCVGAKCVRPGMSGDDGQVTMAACDKCSGSEY